MSYSLIFNGDWNDIIKFPRGQIFYNSQGDNSPKNFYVEVTRTNGIFARFRKMYISSCDCFGPNTWLQKGDDNFDYHAVNYQYWPRSMDLNLFGPFACALNLPIETYHNGELRMSHIHEENSILHSIVPKIENLKIYYINDGFNIFINNELNKHLKTYDLTQIVYSYFNE